MTPPAPDASDRALLEALAERTGGGLAEAQEAPRLGSDGHGVRLVQRGRPDRLVVLLSAERHARAAGKRLTMLCAHEPAALSAGRVAAVGREPASLTA